MIYPNGKLMNPPPIAMGIFTSLLKTNGFEVDLFDSTLYPDPESIGSDEAKEENLQARPADYGSRGIKLKESRMEVDLIEKVKEFSPDIIALSLLESTYSKALSLLLAIKDFKIPVIAGGVFATFAPEVVLANESINMVCIGEGEEALIEVCQRMVAGADYSDVDNLWFKSDGRIIRNKLRKPVDINELLIPDYSLFEPERFLRPMGGKIYRAIPIETNRGCPYSCTFCNSPAIAELYKNNGHYKPFFRKKDIRVIGKELRYLVKRWDAEYVYFSSDTFLTLTDTEFDSFIAVYKEIGLPFWMQSRVEAITEYRIRKLKEVGCHRMSIGLEHGNDDFRRRVLKKKFVNKQMIKASKIIAKVGIPLTVNNIIGFPDETRELVFDTVELNRKLTFDTVNAVAFAPFHGTPLQKLCVARGYISEDFNPGSLNVDAPLDMPQLSQEQIKGLRRTFALYTRLPKKYWPQIEKAEKFDEEGNRIFADLQKVYRDKYFV